MPNRLIDILRFGFRRGYKLTVGQIQIRQRGGWVSIPLRQVHAVKFPKINRLVIRLYDGRRFVLDLFGFRHSQIDRAVGALRRAQKENAAKRQPNAVPPKDPDISN